MTTYHSWFFRPLPLGLTMNTVDKIIYNTQKDTLTVVICGIICLAFVLHHVSVYNMEVDFISQSKIEMCRFNNKGFKSATKLYDNKEQLSKIIQTCPRNLYIKILFQFKRLNDQCLHVQNIFVCLN